MIVIVSKHKLKFMKTSTIFWSRTYGYQIPRRHNEIGIITYNKNFNVYLITHRDFLTAQFSSKGFFIYMALQNIEKNILHSTFKIKTSARFSDPCLIEISQNRLMA